MITGKTYNDVLDKAKKNGSRSVNEVQHWETRKAIEKKTRRRKSLSRAQFRDKRKFCSPLPLSLSLSLSLSSSARCASSPTASISRVMYVLRMLPPSNDREREREGRREENIGTLSSLCMSRSLNSVFAFYDISFRERQRVEKSLQTQWLEVE